jgi:signal transduction histidine kinase
MDVPVSPLSSGYQRHFIPRFLIDASQARSILSSLSHELCHHLASLRTGFDLMRGESAAPVTEDQRGQLETLLSLCDDLLRFTRSSLDYTAIAQGSRPLCLGSFTIGAFVHEIDRQFAPIARSRRIGWETRVKNPESPVLTDASRCQQILGHLVGNALECTPPGGHVRVIGQVDAGSWELAVSDSGPGIPTSWHELVFEPFVRLAHDEHSGMAGHGLGLAICRELVAQLDGTIALNSSEGHGTLVTVRFPEARATPAETMSHRI